MTIRNIFNSSGVHVATVRNSLVYDVNGIPIYGLRGVSIYRLTGELVGHLNDGGGTTRLDRRTDKLFPGGELTTKVQVSPPPTRLRRDARLRAKTK